MLPRYLPRSPKARIGLLLVIWAAVVGTLAGLLADSQANTREGIDERFDLRTEIASRFVTTYVDDLIARQRELGRRRLSGERVEERPFQRAVADGGYEAAVLLDGGGRLLQVAPPSPGLIGQDLTRRYDHLRRGVAGEVAVSDVVPSAVRGIPVVAFAVPFGTDHGRRVYSAAYDVSRTPLGAYLRNAIQIDPNQVYLIDENGRVIARNGAAIGSVRSLSRLEPGLARALSRERVGSYDAGGEQWRYASRPVDGTPWRIAIAVPGDLLYTSIGGVGRWLTWLAVGGFALVGLAVIALLARLMDSRSRLSSANVALDRLSRVDPLTGLHNRRHLEEVLAALVSAGRRHGLPLTLMLIDIDHFKQVNDTHGHSAGDRVLRATAGIIEGEVRGEDAVARWGGEEFLVALPAIDAPGAVAAAERIRAAVKASGVEAPDGGTIGITVTIGVAAWEGESADELITRADAALYLGKKQGRDRVVMAGAEAEAAGV